MECFTILLGWSLAIFGSGYCLRIIRIAWCRRRHSANQGDSRGPRDPAGSRGNSSRLNRTLETVMALAFLVAVGFLTVSTYHECDLQFPLPAGDSRSEKIERFWQGRSSVRGLLSLGSRHPGRPVVGADFDSQPLADDDLARFIVENPRIEWLLIGETRVTNSGLAVLEDFSRLESLGLKCLPVREEGMAHVAKLWGLMQLDLSNTTVSDGMLKSLVPLERLERLHLRSACISDAGLKELHRLRSLTFLDLTGTNATAEGVAALQSTLPDCQILWLPTTESARPKDARAARN